ncbi:MAG: SDR family NAD(P)-dependent oxidoreductase [Chloroflexota bacterium]
MQDKVVMVTGATNGIGEITALELARQGATVVVVSRTLSKLEDTVARIKSETGNQNISYIQADLSSMAEVRNAAEQFLAQFERLDVLVNNAGAYFAERKTTADGYEMTLALNHLNYFLLTDLLLDTIKQTAETQGEARIVNVSP